MYPPIYVTNSMLREVWPISYIVLLSPLFPPPRPHLPAHGGARVFEDCAAGRTRPRRGLWSWGGDNTLLATGHQERAAAAGRTTFPRAPSAARLIWKSKPFSEDHRKSKPSQRIEKSWGHGAKQVWTWRTLVNRKLKKRKIFVDFVAARSCLVACVGQAGWSSCLKELGAASSGGKPAPWGVESYPCQGTPLHI